MHRLVRTMRTKKAPGGLDHRDRWHVINIHVLNMHTQKHLMFSKSVVCKGDVVA